MKQILVTYASMAGSTAEVAQVIGEELANRGYPAEVLPLSQVKDLSPYQAVVVGGPMIVGWHRSALRFLKKHREELKRIPFAVFALAMSLTDTGDLSLPGAPLCLDENLPKPPKEEGRLNFRERFTLLPHYLRPILQATRPLKPATIGVFGGRLEYGRLKWWAVLFAMLIIQAPAGDRRNWPVIRSWAAALPEAFQLEKKKTILSFTNFAREYKPNGV
jgi:menaquinone-dependent protoporphyrinogen IX oxidase